MKKLLDFLCQLDEYKVFYWLSKPSSEPRRCIMVEVVIPGQRWEVEFFEDGEIFIEIFRSDGIYDNEHADDLIKQLLDANDPKL